MGEIVHVEASERPADGTFIILPQSTRLLSHLTHLRDSRAFTAQTRHGIVKIFSLNLHNVSLLSIIICINMAIFCVSVYSPAENLHKFPINSGFLVLSGRFDAPRKFLCQISNSHLLTKNCSASMSLNPMALKIFFTMKFFRSGLLKFSTIIKCAQA